MAPDKKQVSIKNAYKSHVTRALNSLGDAVDNDKEELEIVALIESLDIKFRKYESKATEIHEEEDDDEEIMKDIDEIERIQEEIIRIRVKALSVIKSKNQTKP